AIAHVLFDEDLVDLGPAGRWLDGIDVVRPALERFTPEAVVAVSGIPAATTRRLAREIAAAPRAAVYGRIGANTVEFGTTTSWLADLVTALTGNLDRPGGLMWA